MRSQGDIILLGSEKESELDSVQKGARIGCAGWSIPREAAHRFGSGASHLQRYSQLFNACEINSSFYRSHKFETWERWAESVPAGFQFAVKAPRTITHESGLDCGPELLLRFLREISFLKDKLGPVLFQLPPSLAYGSATANRFFSILRDLYSGDIVLEPRHPSWFVDEIDCLLNKFNIARVAADPACVAAGGDPGGYASLVYFRLHGSPRRYYSAYSASFLDLLAKKLTHRVAHARVWCVFDNTASGSAISNALGLRELMGITSVGTSDR